MFLSSRFFLSVIYTFLELRFGCGRRIPTDNEHSNERGAHTCGSNNNNNTQQQKGGTTRGKTCVPYIYERGKHFRQLIIHSHNVRDANKDANEEEEEEAETGEEQNKCSLFTCTPKFPLYYFS